jgi:hypothetical protein
LLKERHRQEREMWESRKRSWAQIDELAERRARRTEENERRERELRGEIQAG